MKSEAEPTGVIERYAVTGAAGFVGGRLTRHLLASGHEVIAIVRQPEQASKLEARGALVRIADIRNESEIERAIAGATGVFHMAALFNNPESSWDDYRAVNVEGTLNVLRAAKKLGVRRVVHCSTVGVATEAAPPPYSEKTPYSPQPDDKYEVTKCEGEQSAIEYARENGPDLVVIRPAQVYGPGDRSKVKFYKLVRKGVIVSPGRTKKHLIYIDDLCSAFLLAMEKSSAAGRVFLIAGEGPTPLTDIVETAARVLDTPYPRLRLPAMPVTLACAAVENISNLLGIRPVLFKRSMDFFTRTVACDTSKASEILGFEANTSIATGIEATVRDYQRHGLL